LDCALGCEPGCHLSCLLVCHLGCHLDCHYVISWDIIWVNWLEFSCTVFTIENISPFIRRIYHFLAVIQ
jgi:hypothetical protein